MSDATVKFVDIEDPKPVHWWTNYLPFEKQGKKLTVRPVVVFAIAGIMSFLLIIVQLMTDDSRPSPLSSIKPPDSVINASGSQVLNVPPAAANGGGADATDSQQGHHGKKAFHYSGPQVISRPTDLSKIPPGSMLWAKLASGASNGLVRAEVTEGLAVAGEQAIPPGAVLVGRGSSTDERLLIHFSQVVFKDASIGNISAEACDKEDKIVGLKGSKVGSKALNLAGSIGLGFVAGLSEGYQDSQAELGGVVHQPSMKNALLNGTATAALQQSQNLMSDLKNRNPILEVPANTDLCVIFGGEH